MPESEIDAIFKEFIEFWRVRFFSDEYVAWDDPMPGATDLVQACYNKGMHIVYLDWSGCKMRQGTEQALCRCGFPYEIDRTVLFTKPNFGMDDTAYKMDALEEIQKLTIVARIDNEPANINSMTERFPMLFVHTLRQTILFVKIDPINIFQDCVPFTERHGRSLGKRLIFWDNCSEDLF